MKSKTVDKSVFAAAEFCVRIFLPTGTPNDVIERYAKELADVMQEWLEENTPT